MAVKSRFAVYRFITIRSTTLTLWGPVAKGWGFRPKSRITSSGVAVTRQKFVYNGRAPESSTTTSFACRTWGSCCACGGVSNPESCPVSLIVRLPLEYRPRRDGGENPGAHPANQQYQNLKGL